MAGSIEIISLLMGLVVAQPSAPPPEGYCVDCHKKQSEPRLSVPTASIAESVHKEIEGLCVACHGGDVREPTERAHDPELGFRGRPGPKDVPMVCGGCHSDAAYIRRFAPNLSVDQFALYRSSGHGRALANGKEDVATCVTCHGSHGVLKVSHQRSPVHPKRLADTCGSCHSNPEHRAYGLLKKDPKEAWKNSVHGKALLEGGDLSAPTCNDCHGDHGAAPPGVHDIHHACGACHAQQSELFQASPHAAHFARLGFGECEECHSQHDVEPAGDDLLQPSGRGVCKKCHTKDKGSAAATEMLERLRNANATAKRAGDKAEEALRRGAILPEAELKKRELYTALTTLRIAVHGLDPSAMDPNIKQIEAASKKLEDESTDAISSLEGKRSGYGVFIAVLALMAALLTIKVRRLDA